MTASGRAMLVVGVLGLFLVAVLLVVVALERVATDPETPIQANLVIDEGEPYADLVPAPDTIIWQKGQETTHFLSTNMQQVDLRINSVALGLATVQGALPHSGELMVLGASVGCQSWAVSRLTATAIAPQSLTISGNVDRDDFTGTATVYYRMRIAGDTDWQDHSQDVAGPNDTFSQSHNVQEGVWEIEASSYDGFPTALTRFITVDTSAGTTTTDEEAESLILKADTGVGLKGCSEHDDVVLTLNGEEGEEMKRYVFDIGPASPPAPVAPVWAEEYASLRFCADATERETILNGGETVGSVSATGATGYYLAADEHGLDYAYFDISSSGGLTVSTAGADDHTGMDGDRLYSFIVRATNDEDMASDLHVVVLLDKTNPTNNGDGVC